MSHCVRLVQLTIYAVCLFCVSVYANSAFAISMSDFVPSFLSTSPDVESSDTIPVKPLISVKRNASTTKTWYCTRMQNGVSNVFCNKGNNDAESGMIKTITIHGGRTLPVSNSNVDNQLLQNISNLSPALQDQKVLNYLLNQQNQLQDSVSLPIKTGTNTKMNINAQQVEFNIQY